MLEGCEKMCGRGPPPGSPKALRKGRSNGVQFCSSRHAKLFYKLNKKRERERAKNNVASSGPAPAGAAVTASANASPAPILVPKVRQYIDGLGRAPALISLTLRVRDLAVSTSFYTDMMGMQCVLNQPGTCAVVGWPGRGAMVTLIRADPRLHDHGWTEPDTRRDAYVWLGLANLASVEATLGRLARNVGPRARARVQGALVGDTGKIATVGLCTWGGRRFRECSVALRQHEGCAFDIR